MKGQRNDFYSIKKEPFIASIGTNNQSAPQFINIQQFLESRSYELKHFTKILENKLTSKLEHQLLPRHMRRRAMAHNHYRIPLRIRFKSLMDLAPAEGETVSRSRCRRHRRKIQFLLNQYELRQKRYKWMETHIWHAKRFKMTEMWGCRVPFKNNDKSERTVYKLS